MTSCFSAGWLVQPAINHRKFINATGIAAAGPEEVSRSWPISNSIGRRASGSTVATAILQSLIAIEESGEEEAEVRDHPTYISLALSIYNSLRKLDTFADEQKIHFSAQDDSWESNY